MNELGWIEGRNLATDVHPSAEFTRAAEAMVRSNVDVIVVVVA